jgi:hypothetical protein
LHKDWFRHSEVRSVRFTDTQKYRQRGDRISLIFFQNKESRLKQDEEEGKESRKRIQIMQESVSVAALHTRSPNEPTNFMHTQNFSPSAAP